MRNILFALDDNHLSETAFAFVKAIKERENVIVTGLYIPALTNDFQWTSADDEAFYIPRFIKENDIAILDNISAFKNACNLNHISYRIHGDLGNTALAGIRRETRFADLLIIGLEKYEKEQTEVFPYDDIRAIIEIAECPVLLIPPGASFPENVIIAYDSSEDAVYALKLFSYILPSMTELPALIVYASAVANEIPDGEYIKELAARYFSKQSCSLLKFNPKKQFAPWMQGHSQAIAVTGAYGRSNLSQLFKRSFIADLLHNLNVPVFIAHK